MKFYDRKSELQLFGSIRKLAFEEESQMTVLVGRRRIGKTELAIRCGGDAPLLYFFVARKSETMLCEDFVAEAEYKLGIPIGHYTSFAMLFRHLLLISESRAFTLIIDEFQDWSRINSSVFSEIQREWDMGRSRGHMNLIVSGSIYSLMHRIFEDSKEPLFSRAGRIVNLQPFETSVLKEILGDYNPCYTPSDLLTLFSVTGGVAWYVNNLMSCRKLTSNDMISMLTEYNSPFINEGKNLLVEEFGSDYAIYFSILSCIAGGEMTRGEIENKTGVKEIGGYLDRLQSHYSLIDKHVPLFAKPKSKNVRYVIHDNFLTLWFRFFYKYQSYIESGALSQLKRIIDRDFASVSGFMLERYFMNKFRESGEYTHIGQYWDRKGENEIDLVAVNEIDRNVWIYEVKRDRSRYDASLLLRKAEHFIANCPQLHDMQVYTKCLSLDDM